MGDLGRSTFEFRNVSIVKSASDEKNDIVNHVAICDEVQKRSQRFNRISPKKVKVVNHRKCALLCNRGRVKRRRLVHQKVTVGGAAQVDLHI